MGYTIRAFDGRAYNWVSSFLKKSGVIIVADVPEEREVHLGNHQDPTVIHRIRQKRGRIAVERRIHSAR